MLITSSEAAVLLGVKTGDTAGGILRKWGVQPDSRQPGRSGENLYLEEDVLAVKRKRPGRGVRTDLRKVGGRRIYER